MTTIIPSVALIGMLAMLSLFAATILSRPWMQYVALGCAGVETVAVIVLIVATR